MADRLTEGIDPARALGELARILLSQGSLETVLTMVAELAKLAVPGAEEVSLTLVRNDRGYTAAASGKLAVLADEFQYNLDSGPCVDASRGNEVVVIDDMSTERRWPDYCPLAFDAGAGSSLSVPLPVQEQVLGAMNVYSTVTNAFDARSVELGTTFAAHAAIAVANAELYASTAERAEQLQVAMASRAVIEQAKGIIMSQRRCTPSEAFDLLIAASQRENVKLRVIAERIVAGVHK